MMGRRSGDQASLFYEFRLDDRIPKNHLLRRINALVTAALGDVHEQLDPYYSEIGRPSVNPDLMIRMLIVYVLQELGYLVLEASTGAAGLKAIQSDAKIDLLITDVGLPGGMNGRQLADAARQARPNLGILFITGYAEGSVAPGGKLGQNMHVLTKPFTMEALTEKIAGILRK